MVGRGTLASSAGLAVSWPRSGRAGVPTQSVGTRLRSLLFLLFISLPASLPPTPKKVVIPFDFVSKFDDGRYGQMLGDMIWKKLSREGGFIIPESMLDVRDYCESHKLEPSPDMAAGRR